MKAANTLPGFRDPLCLTGLPPETPLIVALSGGADSVALLSLLRDRKNLSAVHVHHGIRGAEADRDADFCRTLAEGLGIPFYLLRIDAPALAKARGESLETAARDARYAAITALMRQQGIPLLVTAHHADDQLETMLQHLLRGSGTRGLGGIPACRALGEGLLVARPLLSVPKSALLAYLKEQGLSYVIDSTNEELCCQRNFLRHRVLPLLTELQPQAALLAARCAEALRADEAYLDGLAADFLRLEGSTPTCKALSDLPGPLLLRVMRRLLPEPPTAQHMEAICRLLQSEKPHAALSLPPKTVLRVENGRLTVGKRREADAPHRTMLLCHSESEINPADALVILGDIGKDIRDALAARYRYGTVLRIASSAVCGTLRLRARLPGDVILSGGMHKTVRRLAATQHLPPEVRATMPLLADDKGLLAVPFGPVRDGAGKNTDLTVSFYFN